MFPVGSTIGSEAEALLRLCFRELGDIKKMRENPPVLQRFCCVESLQPSCSGMQILHIALSKLSGSSFLFG